MSDEAVVAKWIDERVKEAEAGEGMGRALITVVQMQDGRRFKVSIEPAKHADEMRAEAMARILGYIVRSK